VICFAISDLRYRKRLDPVVTALQEAGYDKAFHDNKAMIWVTPGAPDV